MASLRYHAGRMVLYEEEPTVWRVKIIQQAGDHIDKLNTKSSSPKSKRNL